MRSGRSFARLRRGADRFRKIAVASKTSTSTLAPAAASRVRRRGWRARLGSDCGGAITPVAGETSEVLRYPPGR